MEINMKKNSNSKANNASITPIGMDTATPGAFEQVIGGGTALIRGKKPTFTAYNAKKDTPNNEIITDPFGSWTGVPVDDPYEKPVQDADDL